jgi:hypothetical protein
MPDQLARLQEALADRYTLQHELGRGGMATVYLAEDLKHHRPVALGGATPECAADPLLHFGRRELRVLLGDHRRLELPREPPE